MDKVKRFEWNSVIFVVLFLFVFLPQAQSADATATVPLTATAVAARPRQNALTRLHLNWQQWPCTGKTIKVRA